MRWHVLYTQELAIVMHTWYDAMTSPHPDMCEMAWGHVFVPVGVSDYCSKPPQGYASISLLVPFL